MNVEWLPNSSDPMLANTDDLRDLCRTAGLNDNIVAEGEVGIVFPTADGCADGSVAVFYGKSWLEIKHDLEDLLRQVTERETLEAETAWDGN